MFKYKIYCAGSICLLSLLFACNEPEKTERDGDHSQVGSTRADTTASTAPLPQNEHLHRVEISKMKFNPDELTIPAGDTVEWINNDMTNHCITEVGKSWTSSSLAPGQSFKKAITKSTDYFCAIHLVMKGKIQVD